MKKNLLLLFVFFIQIQFLNAQVITFDKSFDSWFQDNLVDVEQTTDGGYIAIGSTRGFSLAPGIANLYIRKYDAFGDTLWTKAIGDTIWMYPSSIKQTSDGGYLICGQAQYPGNQAYIAKLNQTGAITWQKWVGNHGSGWAWFSSAKQNADGSFIAAGSLRRSNSIDSTTYVYLIKFDPTGTPIWEKTFRQNQTLPGQYLGQDLSITSDGGYFITASSINQTGGNDAYLIKTNGAGVAQWTKLYPQINSFSGKQTADGGYIIGGARPYTSTQPSRSKMLKLNTTGDTVWTKLYPGNGINSVVQTSDGGYAFTGSIPADTLNYGNWPFVFEDLLAVKTDAAGNMRFLRTYGDSIDDAGSSIRQTTDGGFIIAGVKDYIFAVGVGPLPSGPDKGLLLKINFTAQDEVLSTPEKITVVNNLTIFPNPATEELNIKISEKGFIAENLTVRITNTLGVEVLKTELKETSVKLNRGNLASGLYLVQLIQTESGKVLATQKVLLK